VLPLLRCSWPPGVHGVFTTRSGGVSLPPYADLNLGDHVGDDSGAVRENRRRVAAALGLSPDRLAFMKQVHGRDVAVLDTRDVASTRPRTAGAASAGPPTADALVTATPGLAVGVLVADCVPVLLAEPYAGVVAAVHAGRRGVELAVVPAAVQAMTELGARPSRIHARLGPAVGPCCYEVPEDLQATVAAHAPDAVGPDSQRSRSGRPSLDLRAGVEGQLRHVGVEHIASVGGCTADDPDLYSYRRDRTTGRFAGLVWLEA
jgi:polyphenol oxidase